MGAPVQQGEILARKYRVERVLGQGGMGVVVAARHVELDELVALKFLLPEALSEPEAVARFLKEARASVRIKSEHVARVHDVGQLESGAPYIVMEYLEGSDLAALLRQRSVLAVEDVVDYVLQACEAIANAHSLGVIHRDLKPSNLMLVVRSDGSECIKVLDFGISKVASAGGRESSMSMTRTAASLGSPLYMSPEQMMSARDVDGRTDIWALGTIVYELLTGKPPFMADTLPALGVLIATTEPTSMRALRPDLPPGLEAVATRCLQKNRDQRFANVAELAQALAPFAPERSLVSVERAARILHVPGAPPSRFERTPPRPTPTPVAASADPVPEVASLPWRHTATASNFGHTAPRTGARRKLITAAGVLLVIAIVSVAALLAVTREPPPQPAASLPPASAAPPPPPVDLPEVPQLRAPPVALAAPPPVDSVPSEVPPPPRRVTHPSATPRASAQAAPARPPPPAGPQPPAPGQKAAYEDM